MNYMKFTNKLFCEKILQKNDITLTIAFPELPLRNNNHEVWPLALIYKFVTFLYVLLFSAICPDGTSTNYTFIKVGKNWRSSH